MSGKVHIVGAGPGAVDLLTVRAAAIIRSADVVLHDDLVPAEVLALASAGAEIISVGKRCGSRTNSQENIHALMIWHAENGRNVVRLKSGDPALFARLGEEIDALRWAGVAFEIVPGVTAASAAAAAAGITLTDRRVASALVVSTAHTCRTGDSSPHLQSSGSDRTTFAVYMPGPDYGRTAQQLMRAGLDVNTPCVVVSQASRSTQQICYLTISDLPFATGIAAPAVLLVGEVARNPHTQSQFPAITNSLEGSMSQLSAETRIPRINEPAPDFQAKSTHGIIRLSDYTSRGKWVLLFSHPADFTPVCTTEFVEFGRSFPEFEKRNVQLIGVSVDSISAHIAWLRNIEQNFNVRIDFPVVADLDQKVAGLYGLVHEAVSDTAAVRAVFFIDPKQNVRALLYYPLSLGRSIPEIIRVFDALQTAEANGVSTPANWVPGKPVIVPPPQTKQDAEVRARSNGDLKVKDWYFAEKELVTAAGK